MNSNRIRNTIKIKKKYTKFAFRIIKYFLSKMRCIIVKLEI